MMTPLLLLLVTPGLGFHLPGDERTDTGTPDTCQVLSQVRHIVLTSPVMQASDNQPGQCIEITKCEAVGRE